MQMSHQLFKSILVINFFNSYTGSKVKKYQKSISIYFYINYSFSHLQAVKSELLEDLCHNFGKLESNFIYN